MSEVPEWIGRKGGLRFACLGCGNCCRGEGYVWVTEPEIERLARFLNLERDAFGQRFLRRTEGGLALVNKPNHDCVFWEAGVGCSVYGARPTQCRTYPFWPEMTEDPETWAAEGQTCRGIACADETTRLYTAAEIRLCLDGALETDPGREGTGSL